MISFDTKNGKFNYRSAAVIVHENHVLIHRAMQDDFWALPGGRVEFLENSDQTVTREIFEELGLESIVVKHIWHVENFFEYNSVKYHELSNYYLVNLVGSLNIKSEIDFEGIEHNNNLIFRWVPFANISAYNLNPKFLVGGLNDFPDSTVFLQVNEINA